MAEETVPVAWVASSKKDFGKFPDDVQQVMGFALYLAQTGGKHDNTKPLRGFGGAGVLEVVEDHRGDTFRCVYTVRLADTVYVLHAFQKKSKSGIATPQTDIDKIKKRLKAAQDDYETRAKAKVK